MIVVGLPAAIVARLNDATGKLVVGDEMKKRLADAGAEPAVLSPAEFGGMVKLEIAKWAKVAKDRGIRAD